MKLGSTGGGPARPTVSLEEWKKVPHGDRMMWEYVAAEVEKDIKEGLERRTIKAEKKADKKKDKAKKSKDGKDAAAAKQSVKDAKKLRRTVLRSIQKIDSAQDRNVHEEVGFRKLEDMWGTGDWVLRNGHATTQKHGESY